MHVDTHMPHNARTHKFKDERLKHLWMVTTECLAKHRVFAEQGSGHQQVYI